MKYYNHDLDCGRAHAHTKEKLDQKGENHENEKHCKETDSKSNHLKKDRMKKTKHHRSKSHERSRSRSINGRDRRNRLLRSYSQQKDRKQERSNNMRSVKREHPKRECDPEHDCDTVGGYKPRRKQEDVQSITTTSVATKNIQTTASTAVHKSVSGGLDYFTQLRATGCAIALNPLEKAAVHAAQYLAMDPLEKMRRQVEQTLEAKLGLLQTKLDNARDPKNKTQRKIYAGNLTPSINGEFLRQLFTQTLLISYPQWNTPGQDCVVEVQYRDGNKYCFLEFRTMEMATAALQVNGVTVLDTQLQVSRPTGFLDPHECEKAVKESEQELVRFRSGEDEGPLLRQPGYAELVAKIKGQHTEPDNCRLQKFEETRTDIDEPSSYLSFDGIVAASSLDSSDEVLELYNDLRSKAGEYGDVTRMVIPRPPMGIRGSDVFGKGPYGKAFIQFSSTESAEAAKLALNGVGFDGRTVKVQSVTEVTFLRALGI